MANLSPVLVFILMFSVVVSVAAKGKQYPSINVTVTVNVSKGEDRFEKEIGEAYTLKTMTNSTSFVWDTLVTYNKTVKKVSLFIQDMGRSTRVGVASKTIGNEIHVNASYIQGYKGNVKTELTGIVFNNMTRVFLLSGRGVPETVLSGIADYVRLKAGYNRSDWVLPKGGNSWNESSNVTARFFAFCERITSGFVKALCNQTSTNSFEIDNFFKYFFQQNVTTMWGYYKKDGVPPWS